MQKVSSLRKTIRKSFLACHLILGILEVALSFWLRSPQGRMHRVHLWSKRMLWILGITLQTAEGEAKRCSQKQLIVSNHISWIDIFVINAVTPCRFVSKADVRHWPLIGWLCANTGTLFVDRTRRHATKYINKQMVDALHAGDQLAIFPEGTTTDGSVLLAFNASLLQPAFDAGVAVQPITVQYQQAEKLSDAAAYIGEMSLMDSINSIAAARGLCARVHFLAPIAIEDHTRREVAVQAEAQIALSLGVNNPRSSSPTEDAQAPNA